MIPIDDNILGCIRKIALSVWRVQITSRLRLYLKLGKENTALSLLTTWYQYYSRMQKKLYNKWVKPNQITETVEMKIYIYNTIIEFGSSVKTSNVDYSVKRRSVDTKSTIFNTPSGFLHPYL